MSSSRKFFTVFLFSTYLLILSAAQPNPKNCSTNEDGCWVRCLGFHDNSNSTYQTNLNRLFSSFTSNSENSYGFYNVSFGQTPDQVNAVALCRGDLISNPGVCLSCFNNATTELRKGCPDEKEAIVWNENCMFHYANRSIFGVLDSNSFTSSDGHKVANASVFNGVLSPLLKSLRSKAAAGDSLLKFATGTVAVSGLQNIFALVQCTPDLSQPQCNECLCDAIGQIPDCCDGWQGVRIFGPSCNLRFEISPFYNLTADGLVPSLSPPASNDTPNTSPGENENSPRIIIIIVVSVVGFLILIICSCICFFFWLRKSKKRRHPLNKIEDEDEDDNAEALQFDFNTIRIATDNFSSVNKLGEGGFGAVYKGTLQSGKDIAVKRLSTNSVQGELQFKNEVRLLARLQHRNLVRLLGFCLDGDERLLIYEFVPNSSLDHFIFDPIKRLQLDWDTRYKIIGAIARGILYLHEDSRYRIIHRDLKAANILLDEEINPKISDFGLARLFANNQSQADTGIVAGTLGYMAPEYTRRGHFSAKSDVYSFGVLVLEIISGQKIHSCIGEDGEDLLTHAWKHWMEGTALELIDPILRDGSTGEMTRCIQIGLLCVQENVAKRPTMASVVLMLSSSSGPLPVPSKSAYLMHSIMESDTSSEAPVQFTVNQVSISELDPR
ncbi:hypothetical protein SLE2022_172940 [Rubroshorea leprosula]